MCKVMTVKRKEPEFKAFKFDGTDDSINAISKHIPELSTISKLPAPITTDDKGDVIEEATRYMQWRFTVGTYGRFNANIDDIIVLENAEIRVLSSAKFELEYEEVSDEVVTVEPELPVIPGLDVENIDNDVDGTE